MRDQARAGNSRSHIQSWDLASPSPGHPVSTFYTKMCISHLPWKQISPQAPVGTFQYTTHRHFGANSSSFYWPHGKCAFRSEHSPAPKLPGCVPRTLGSSTSPPLPAWRESSAPSQPQWADLCPKGRNQQSAQLDFHSTESSTPRKWNLTVQNAWEHSVSKVLNTGGFPLPQKWVGYL